jgi:hypothetical protein
VRALPKNVDTDELTLWKVSGLNNPNGLIFVALYQRCEERRAALRTMFRSTRARSTKRIISRPMEAEQRPERVDVTVPTHRIL